MDDLLLRGHREYRLVCSLVVPSKYAGGAQPRSCHKITIYTLIKAQNTDVHSYCDLYYKWLISIYNN